MLQSFASSLNTKSIYSIYSSIVPQLFYKFKKLKLIFNGEQSLYVVMWVSAVKCSESAIYTHIS